MSFNFPKEEEAILEFWKQTDAFQTSLKLSEGKPEYRFYDGPPFATGLPHYGHIIAGTIKDVVTRYFSMNGYHVSRRFGWDCHGVPIEFEVEKHHGMSKPNPNVEGGVTIAEYNQKCREVVMLFANEWETIITRAGRWIDFKNDYKTMSLSFMESVWWAFDQLFDRNLVYRGVKVMPYSTALRTPLSNFEAKQNYKDVKETALYVGFSSADGRWKEETQLVAWTTTPWTLPSNLALAVNQEFDYVRVKSTNFNEAEPVYWVLAKDRLCAVMNAKELETAQIVEEFKGKDLVGLHYKPMFPYFVEKAKETSFRVVAGSFVEAGSGSGIVHCAPFFGEDDYAVCVQNHIISNRNEPYVCPVDEAGLYTDEVSDYAGRYVKDCDKDLIKRLKAEKRVLKQEQFTHSYPFCWRSDTPLLYKAVSSWFVSVEDIKSKDMPEYVQVSNTDEILKAREERRAAKRAEANGEEVTENRLLESLDTTYWVPDSIKTARFHGWLRDARDWAISRNRFWGTPIPLWVSDDGEEIVSIGSVKELEEKAGLPAGSITDIHRDKIDDITIPSSKGKGALHRIPEIFDCWFESGSMPYAQVHFPFENEDLFKASFPAEFIAEGVDQTRGWFYTLLVLSTALFGTSPFKNVIVNGIVLAGDGQKMSKRLKNYPDPVDVINTHGADALRLYLISSPAVHAEDLAFKEEGVFELKRQVLNPWLNVFRLFEQNVNVYNSTHPTFICDEKRARASTNAMDVWILAETETLIATVRAEMEKYYLHTVVPPLLKYINDLTNWYVRLNRKRLKGSNGDEEWEVSLSVLASVLNTLGVLMAPFTPFLVEYIYQRLKASLPAEHQFGSVHFAQIPNVQQATEAEKAKQAEIIRAAHSLQAAINLGRQIREKAHVSLKIPLKEAVILTFDPQMKDDIAGLQQYVKTELTVSEVTVADALGQIELKCTPSRLVWRLASKESKKTGKPQADLVKELEAFITSLTPEQTLAFEMTGEVVVPSLGLTLTRDEITVERQLVGDNKNKEYAQEGRLFVILSTETDTAAIQQGHARTLVNRIQKAKKRFGLVREDKVEIFVGVTGKKEALGEKLDRAKKVVVPPPVPKQEKKKPEPKKNEDKKEEEGKEGKKGGKQGKAAQPKKEPTPKPTAAKPEKKQDERTDEQCRKDMSTVITTQSALIKSLLNQPVFPLKYYPALRSEFGRVEDEVDGCGVTIVLARPGLDFSDGLRKTNPAACSYLTHFVGLERATDLAVNGDGTVKFRLSKDEKEADKAPEVTLKYKTDFFLSTAETLQEGKYVFPEQW
ncbi:putative Isoleucine--tRNA ligase [Blattamonas nauphoetae]|uniref:isoleucine--tRNA ligase n=1 Tax=Blattamonas nauphoetae TaxID=2049346 RepID=A0ABQ9XI41_9EUKA|nr:putative Isoleucine--tRNA ligase [Blattamonas nauphoetae]